MSNPDPTIQLRAGPPTFAYLIVTDGDHAGAIFQIRGVVTNVGRGGANDVQIDDPAVSSEHLRIRREAGAQFTLVDRGSENGTRVNGRSVQQHLLGHDDIVEIGATHLVFKRIAPEAG